MSGRSWWSKAAKVGWKVIQKGGDLAAAVEELHGIVQDVNTVLDSNASTSDRLIAGISLLSEAAPVSVGDLKDAKHIVEKVPGGKKLLEKGVEALDAGLDKAKDALGAAKKGKVYRVPPSGTPSGKPYVGRTQQASPKSRGSRDGRDRSEAEVVDTYDPGVPGAGRVAEQRAMNAEGGLDALDNKRNEIAAQDWSKHGVDPPDTE